MGIAVFPLDPVLLGLFVTHLFERGYAVSTIRMSGSAIAYWHKIRLLPDPSTSFIVVKALEGFHRLRPAVDSRRPITKPILASLILQLQQVARSPYEVILFRAMFSFAFFGLCRIGEVTAKPGTHTLERLDVTLNHNDRFIVTFRTFKHSVSKQSITLYRQSPVVCCPVYNLSQYLSICPNGKYLFVLHDGKPVTRVHFTYVFKKCLILCNLDVQNFAPHSFRIGGATYAASKGMSALQIKRLGRWKSNAFTKYIRW